MDISVLTQYANIVIVGICLCVGFVVKYAIPTQKINRYIPLIVAMLGVALAFWANGTMTPEILLQGLFSGLASTGLYEAFINLIGLAKKE